jgi:hypothetical protein
MDAGRMRLGWLAGGVLAAALGVGAWQGAAWLNAATPPPAAAPSATPAPTPAPSAAPTSPPPAVKGETPMPQRVAVIGFLNKRNGASRDLTLKPGQAIRIGDAIVRLRACERTAPWEQDQLTGAFLQLDVEGTDKAWRRVFSGWVYKERPALNVVQHRIYDVWPKSCTMSFPATGPDTVVLSSPGAATRATRRASSADQSPSTDGLPEAIPATEGPSAAASNTL